MAPESSTKETKATKEEPKLTLASGDADAAYVSPDMTFRDGGGESLPEVEEKHIEALKKGVEEEAKAAEEHEDKVAKQRVADEEKAAKEAAKADDSA